MDEGAIESKMAAFLDDLSEGEPEGAGFVLIIHRPGGGERNTFISSNMDPDSIVGMLSAGVQAAVDRGATPPIYN